MIDQNALNVYYHVIGAYQACIAVFGTIGSILVFVVAIRLRKTTTFVFIAFLAITDAIALYWWNLNELVFIYFGYWFMEESIYGCKIVNFFQYVSMQSSAWILVSGLIVSQSLYWLVSGIVSLLRLRSQSTGS